MGNRNKIKWNNASSKIVDQGANNKNVWYKLGPYHYVITGEKNCLALVISSQYDKEVNSVMRK